MASTFSVLEFKKKTNNRKFKVHQMYNDIFHDPELSTSKKTLPSTQDFFDQKKQSLQGDIDDPVSCNDHFGCITSATSVRRRDEL